MNTGSARIAALAGGIVVASAALLAGGRAVGAAVGPDHATLRVGPGQSIQAAIDAARPGDTVVVAPGVYHENLTVTTDDITLRGSGPGVDGTVLVAPATPNPSPCTELGEVNGICVAGEFTLGSDQVGRPVHGVRLSGFRVTGFSRFGIVVYNAVDTTVADNDVSHGHRYGIVGFSDSGLRLVGNASHDNGQGGIYVGDSPDADLLVAGNRSYGNAASEGIGIFLRDVSHGVVRGNLVERNCVGLLLVDSAGEAPTSDWAVRDNTVRANTAACAPTDDVPVPLSGFGIALLGTTATTVSGNVVTGNAPSADVPIAGGIVLASAESIGGPQPSGTIVRGNVVRGNLPADLVTDGSGSGNRLVGNACGMSLPDGLCR